MRSIRKFYLLILTAVMVGGCQSERLREAAIDSQVTEAQAPNKTWRVKPGSVHDGDTFRAIADVTNEEIKIRIACIDAPEIKQAGGIEARDYLRGMLPDDQEIILVVADVDQYGRNVAEVYAKTDTPELEVGINGEMVAAGMAHYYERYKKSCPDNADLYGNLEQQAIARKAGVWANGNAERPWDFRRQNK